MDVSALNGFFTANFTSGASLPEGMYEFSRADLVIRDGRIAGYDVGGCLVTGTLRAAADGQFEATVTLDPRTGQPDAVMFQDDGSFRRVPVVRTLFLKLTEANGRVFLRGGVQVGPFDYAVFVQRVGGFDGNA
ncbi:MAG: hypothetical protein LDL39_05410 [Magnetospirillum sp.]|nr:hypothetical protein [Magnetospirillum sp.]